MQLANHSNIYKFKSMFKASMKIKWKNEIKKLMLLTIIQFTTKN